MLKCLVRYFVGHVRLVQGISEQRRVKAPRVDRQRLRWMRACQEEHGRVPIFFHGVNLLKAGSWTRGARSLSAALEVLLRS